ncbi:hypothetical protein DQ04_17551000 [Trypanosoma grayi]|uniref:hypothetical protein n=1 Tax=Trypanosoma grayi TaxID=71804 RepID=UPI0004F48A0F|nr:hypothetical protein DQ04_17551000 [Trypanosoma grayi]KEG05888.1 hypothetical protein DQ04_17551000 [Trypanosoma grayi]
MGEVAPAVKPRPVVIEPIHLLQTRAVVAERRQVRLGAPLLVALKHRAEGGVEVCPRRQRLAGDGVVEGPRRVVREPRVWVTENVKGPLHLLEGLVGAVLLLVGVRLQTAAAVGNANLLLRGTIALGQAQHAVPVNQQILVCQLHRLLPTRPLLLLLLLPLALRIIAVAIVVVVGVSIRDVHRMRVFVTSQMLQLRLHPQPRAHFGLLLQRQAERKHTHAVCQPAEGRARHTHRQRLGTVLKLWDVKRRERHHLHSNSSC